MVPFFKKNWLCSLHLVLFSKCKIVACHERGSKSRTIVKHTWVYRECGIWKGRRKLCAGNVGKVQIINNEMTMIWSRKLHNLVRESLRNHGELDSILWEQNDECSLWCFKIGIGFSFWGPLSWIDNGFLVFKVLIFSIIT